MLVKLKPGELVQVNPCDDVHNCSKNWENYVDDHEFVTSDVIWKESTFIFMKTVPKS